MQYIYIYIYSFETGQIAFNDYVFAYINHIRKLILLLLFWMEFQTSFDQKYSEPCMIINACYITLLLWISHVWFVLLHFEENNVL